MGKFILNAGNCAGPHMRVSFVRAYVFLQFLFISSGFVCEIKRKIK